MKGLYQSLLVLGLVFLGLNCSKTYTLPPVSSTPTAPTSTPNPLVCTASPTPGAPPNGIYWYSAQVEGIAYNNGVTTAQGIFAQVLLTVNGIPETTDTVSVVGPGGLNAVLPYTNNVIQNGNTYAQYQSLLPNTYQPSGNYSLTTVTTIGQASATIVGPGNISIASDGSFASWTQPGLQNTLIVQVGGFLTAPATLYQTAACANETSPVNIPASDYSYSNPAVYTITADCQTSTKSIAGGSGFFKVSQEEVLFIYTCGTPTPTPASCGGGGPSCTPSPTAVPDTFTVSPSSFQPAIAPVTISVSYPNYPGLYLLTVYNDSYTLVKALDALILGSPRVQNYAWDGTDKYGNPAPDGIYVLYLQEPFEKKLWLIELIR